VTAADGRNVRGTIKGAIVDSLLRIPSAGLQAGLACIVRTIWPGFRHS
jgi:hypothetical protein